MPVPCVSGASNDIYKLSTDISWHFKDMNFWLQLRPRFVCHEKVAPKAVLKNVNTWQ